MLNRAKASGVIKLASAASLTAHSTVIFQLIICEKSLPASGKSLPNIHRKPR
jgi:hypothetical protein